MSRETDDRAVFTPSKRGGPDAEAIARVARFLAVGLLNTAFGYAAFYAALRLFGHPAMAAASSTTLGALFNFVSIGRIVFRSSDHRLLGRFVAVYALIFTVNSAALLLLGRGGLRPELAQALLLPGLAALSYRLNRDFVFAEPRIIGGAA